MASTSNPNLALLELAVHDLGDLVDDFVFVGGCATGLLIDDAAAPPIRETIDIDVIVPVLSKGRYYALAERLRKRGFMEDVSDNAPVCRWTNKRVILDVMPVEPSVLGFGNAWYLPAMANADSIRLPSGKLIRLVSPPYFLVTKLEAFKGRGGGDYQMSHDLEDVVAVIDGRHNVLGEVRRSAEDVRTALARNFQLLLGDPQFLDAVHGHMPTDDASQARVPIILDRMRQIAEME
ncbi:hypothetical protein [Thiolapillus sp.]